MARCTKYSGQGWDYSPSDEKVPCDECEDCPVCLGAGFNYSESD